ncbi:hypothetical protein vseg_006095 [Gypsophila vaccaria]
MENNNNNDFLSLEGFGDLSQYKDLTPFEWLLVVGAKASEVLNLNSIVDPNAAPPPPPPLSEHGGGRRGRRGNANSPIREDQSPPLPTTFLNKIEELGGFQGEPPKLIFGKKLFKTNVDQNQYKLSMPDTQCNKMDLTPEELKEVTRIVGKKYIGLDVDVIQPTNGLKITELSLKKYDISGVHSFAFGGKTWKTFVRDNQLKVDDDIQVWQFRLNPNLKLCFAIVKLDR